MLYRALILSALWCCGMLACAQIPVPKNADSLYVKKLNERSEKVFDDSPDSSLAYANQAIALSRKLQYTAGYAEGYLRIGDVYCLRGDYPKAEQYFKEAISIFSRLKDRSGLSEGYRLYGNMYNNLANYRLAIKYINQSLSLSTAAADERGIADAYVYLGIVYDNMGLQPNALDCYYKSLAINLKYNDQQAAANNYNNIGVILQSMEVLSKSLEFYEKAARIWRHHRNQSGLATVYENTGEVLLAQHQYDRAIGFFSQSMAIFQKLGDGDGISSLYTDFGLSYAQKKQFAVSQKYLDSAIASALKYKIEYNRANALIAFATLYNLQQKYTEAYPHAQQGKTLADKLGNNKIKTNAALQLSETLAGLKRFEESHLLLSQYIRLKDSSRNNESIQKFTAYSIELNFAAEQRHLKQQREERDLLFKQKIKTQRLLITLFLLIILGMLVVSIIYYRQKIKLKVINSILHERNAHILHQKDDIDDKANKLGDLNTLKDRLISILAHDLRAPLSTLRGLFGLLEDDTISHQQFLEMIPQVLRKLEYTSDFLDTLLFWINSQMDDFSNATKIFDAHQLVARELRSLDDQAREKEITLINEVEKTASAWADPNSVRIVLHNLLTNAIKFSGRGDTITVFTTADANSTTIIIKDKGIGMDDDMLKKLFKSKVTSNTGTNNEPGTGMGLMFCKDLVERCNGAIWAQSSPGEGSAFFVKLPAGEVVV